MSGDNGEKKKSAAVKGKDEERDEIRSLKFSEGCSLRNKKPSVVQKARVSPEGGRQLKEREK